MVYVAATTGVVTAVKLEVSQLIAAALTDV
jgi:hypothetical protein